MTGAFNISVDFCNNFSGAEDDWTSLDSNTLFDNVILNPGDNTGVMYIRITNSNNYPVSVNASLIEKTVTDNNTELRFYSKKVTEATSADDLLAETPVSLVSAAKFVEDEEIDANSELYVAILVDCVGEDSTPSTQNITAQFKIFLSAAQLNGSGSGSGTGTGEGNVETSLPQIIYMVNIEPNTDIYEYPSDVFIVINSETNLRGKSIKIRIGTSGNYKATMNGTTYNATPDGTNASYIIIENITDDIYIQSAD
jgi:hypothetical protein